MELKVWVDGIQRVVCGVNANTTCNDVVLALAVATNQTGRFTLIEKWRNNERLLSSSEKPVEVLSKWGEYANDVHFVLKRSFDINGNNGNLSNTPPSLKDVFQQQFQQNRKTSQVTKQSSLTNNNDCQNESQERLMPTQDKVAQKDCLKQPAQQNGSSSKSTPPKTHSPHHKIQDSNSANKSKLSTPLQSKEKKRYEVMPSIQMEAIRGRLISSEERCKLRGSTPVMGSKLASDRLKDPLRLMSCSQKRTAVVGSQEKMDTSQSNESLTKRKEATSQPSFPFTSPVCQNGLTRSTVVPLEPLSSEERKIREEVEKKKKEREELLAKASELDAEIAVYRHKIQVLTDRIKEEEHRIEREQIKKEREEMIEKENCISDLKKQIQDCQRDLDQQKKESDAIQTEIRNLEEALIKKYKEMDEVMMDIRKENLNALSLETSASSILNSSSYSSSTIACSPFMKLHSENLGINHLNSLIGSKFYHRIGSTRKMMGSPRSLQTAVASKKNPQGVWV